MTKQTKSTEAQTDEKRQNKSHSEVTSEAVEGQANLAEILDPMAAAGDGSIESQGFRLRDPRLPVEQRQALAAEIGQVQGNRHLQRMVMMRMEQGEPNANSPSTQSQHIAGSTFLMDQRKEDGQLKDSPDRLEEHTNKSISKFTAREDQLATSKMVQRQLHANSPPKADSYSLSFQLPGRATVVGGWNDVYTEAPTTMRLTLNKNRLKVNFLPALIADIQWPASDQAIGSAEYNVDTGAITSKIWDTQAIAINAFGGTAQGRIRQWVREIVTGTPLEITPYDYDTERQPVSDARHLKSTN